MITRARFFTVQTTIAHKPVHFKYENLYFFSECLLICFVYYIVMMMMMMIFFVLVVGGL